MQTAPPSRQRPRPKWRTLRRTCLTLALALSITAPDTPATAAAPLPQLWLSSVPVKGYMNLFATPAQWPVGLSKLRVLKLTTAFADSTGDNTLATIIEFTNQHKIALALEGEMQTPDPNGCGTGIESYYPRGKMKQLAARIKSLGGILSYIAMDEPLWYGHFATSTSQPGARVCLATIDQVAANVAHAIAEVREIFPDVAVGDIEPVSSLYADRASSSDRPIALQHWIDAFARASGRPLAFVHFDIVWAHTTPGTFNASENQYWSRQLALSVQLVRDNRIRVGIIYNGRAQDTHNVSWTNHAIYRYQTIEEQLSIKPDDAIIQTWEPHPDQIVPETTPGTLTNLLRSYIEWHSAAH